MSVSVNAGRTEPVGVPIANVFVPNVVLGGLGGDGVFGFRQVLGRNRVKILEEWIEKVSKLS